MSLLQALGYGIIEGITEFLPISSTGHLMLYTEIVGLEHSVFVKSFEIMIQLGAILAVVILYPKRFFRERETLLRIAVAFLPTAFIGLLLYRVIKMYLMNNIAIVLLALAVGGVAIIALERYFRGRQVAPIPLSSLSLRQTALVGLVQCLAFVPGVSRSGATIFGGMALGLSRKDAVEFSFLLAVPIMGSATLLDLYKSHDAFTTHDVAPLAVGFVSAFVVAYLSLRWLVRYVSQHDFTIFGIYRIVIALIGYFLIFY